MRQSAPSLALTHPDIARGWHCEKNGSLTPNDVTAASQRKVWWRCLKNPDHEWRQNVYRQLKHRCAFCAMEKNNLLVLFPKIAKEWHPTKNGALSPDSIAAGSGKKVWWQCPKFDDHVWSALVFTRTNTEQGCPFCAGRRADARNNLAVRHPDVAAEWHPTKNGELTPAMVTPRSNNKVWWVCRDNKSHEWRTSVDLRVRARTGCPVCARVNSKNNLAKLFPLIAEEWHPTKNGHLFASWNPESLKKQKESKLRNRRLKPSDFAAYSNENAWWQCKTSKSHVWRAKICNRTMNGGGCPFCAGQKVAADNCLANRYRGLAKLWHPTRNMPLTPDQVTAGSSQLVWWRCFKSPLHVWQQQVCVVTRSYKSKKSGCPFCTGRKIGKDNNLAAKFPDVATRWHPTRNSPLRPDQVLPGSPQKVWWQCPRYLEHAFKAEISNMVHNRGSKTRGCAFCSGLRVLKSESLAATHPELLKYWDKSRNLGLTPKQIGSRSHTVVHWRCNKAGEHLWQLSVRDMVRRHTPCLLCEREEKRQVTQSRIDALRKQGASWAAIGAELGVTRQTAWQYSKA